MNSNNLGSQTRWQHLLRGSLAVLSLALLASCGGGKREAFKPGHMYVFGDEYSFVDISNLSSTTYGLRYTVNVVGNASSTLYDFTSYPSWTQYLAAHYGKTELPCADVSAAGMSMCAAPGATVATVISAINTKSYQKDQLVVILAGTHDILQAYQNFKTGGSIDSLATSLRNTGIALGQKINAIVSTGARVAVATVPDIGLSSYAVGEGALRDYNQPMDCSDAYKPVNTGETSKALSYLTACFNAGLRGTSGIINDGKKIALISTFDWTVLLVRNPGGNGLIDAVNAACTTIPHSVTASYTPSDCHEASSLTTPALASTAVASPLNYLWSFGPWLGPGGHTLLGARAVNQVNGNWGE